MKVPWNFREQKSNCELSKGAASGERRPEFVLLPALP